MLFGGTFSLFVVLYLITKDSLKSQNFFPPGGGCHSNPSEWRGARGATTTTRPPSPQLFVTLISPTGSIPWEKRPPAIYHPSPIPCHRPTASAATRGTTKGTLPSTGGVCPPAAFKGECTAALIHVSNLHGLYLKQCPISGQVHRSCLPKSLSWNAASVGLLGEAPPNFLTGGNFHSQNTFPSLI